MLDKILYVVGKSDVPLWLLHSVLSPFLWMGTMTDSFHSSGSSSLFQTVVNVTVVKTVLAVQPWTEMKMLFMGVLNMKGLRIFMLSFRYWFTLLSVL